MNINYLRNFGFTRTDITDYIKYTFGSLCITFDLKHQRINISEGFEFDCQVLAALNKQIKALGWEDSHGR